MNYLGDDDFSYTIGRGPYAYSIVNEDGIKFGPDGSVLVNNKEFIGSNYNAILWKTQTHFHSTEEHWFVPATQIDWSTAESYTNDDGEECVKYYLKSK